MDPLPNNAGFPDPAPGFLPFLRELTQKHGILLICDEIISFRVGYQGASARFGIKPDLVTLGKIIGGGLPVGAVGGSAEAMSVFDPTAGKPRVPHGGTFNANPVTMAAGIAAMGLWTEGAIARLERLGDDLRQRANWALDESGAAVQGDRPGLAVPADAEAERRRLPLQRAGRRQQVQRRELHLRLLGQGVLTSPTGLGCLSTVMDEGEVTEMVEAIRVSASAVTS